MNDERIVALLTEIRDLLRERQSPARSTLDVQDRRALARLLPVVAAQFPEEFFVWELADVAEQDDVAGADMRIALGDLTPHAIGKLFRRAADSGPVAGHRVVSNGRGRWRLIADRSAYTGPRDRANVIVTTSDRRR